MNISGRDIIIYASIINKGNWDNIYQYIKDKIHPETEEVVKVLSTLKSKTITILDKEYPEGLKQIFKPPFVLFYEGDISLINNYVKNIAIVGAREPSEYGTKWANEIVKEIASDYIIVSGLALGIDTCAHTSCIENNGKTIAVLGCGIDVFYPQTNKSLQMEIAKNHLLISEYPDGIRPEGKHFPIRNRIIVGISKGVIIFDCKKNSGTWATVNLAINSNRYLMSPPYPIGTEFINNKLISDGAEMVESGNDVREILSGY